MHRKGDLQFLVLSRFQRLAIGCTVDKDRQEAALQVDLIEIQFVCLFEVLRLQWLDLVEIRQSGRCLLAYIGHRVLVYLLGAWSASVHVHTTRGEHRGDHLRNQLSILNGRNDRHVLGQLQFELFDLLLRLSIDLAEAQRVHRVFVDGVLFEDHCGQRLWRSNSRTLERNGSRNGGRLHLKLHVLIFADLLFDLVDLLVLQGRVLVPAVLAFTLGVLNLVFFVECRFNSTDKKILLCRGASQMVTRVHHPDLPAEPSVREALVVQIVWGVRIWRPAESGRLRVFVTFQCQTLLELGEIDFLLKVRWQRGVHLPNAQSSFDWYQIVLRSHFNTSIDFWVNGEKEKVL